MRIHKTIKFKWQWYNNVQKTGWEDITPSHIDAIIAHDLEPPPKFRRFKITFYWIDFKKYYMNGDLRILGSYNLYYFWNMFMIYLTSLKIKIERKDATF